MSAPNLYHTVAVRGGRTIHLPTSVPANLLQYIDKKRFVADDTELASFRRLVEEKFGR
jgi:hypothetical protein